MLLRLAKSWARLVMRDTRSLVPSALAVLNGAVAIVLHLLNLAPSELILALGVLLVFVGLHLFERAGLLNLFDEIRQSSEEQR